MLLNMFKGKIHRATVTQAELDYVGSITIDKLLLDASGILPGEKVQIVNVNNGARLETYTIEGPEGSGVICLNGAAARSVHVGDRVIIISYCWIEEDKARTLVPKAIFVDDNNKIIERSDREIHGEVK